MSNYTRINPTAGSQPIVRSVRATLPANTAKVAITAPTVSGYSFVCWIGVATNGWVGDPYVQNQGASSTNVWCSRVTSVSGQITLNTSAVEIDAFALLAKN